MPPPLRPRIAIWITAALGALHLISYLAYSQFRGDRNNVNGQKSGAAQTDGHGSLALPWLNELKDSPDVHFPLRFARRDIVIRSVARGSHSSLTRVKDTLLPEFQQFDNFDGAELDKKHSLDPLILETPVTPKPNASHILLGSASNLERLEISIPYFQRWLAYTSIRLIVVVTGPDDSTPDPKIMQVLEGRMRDLGMEVTLVKPLSKKDSFIQRYFSLVKILHEHKNEDTQWLGLVDDDTFFVSMTRMVERLATFDHTQEFCLGNVSEEWWTVVAYGLIAMGGGGIFLSLPVAQVIVDHYDDCKKHTTKIFGDHIIFECIITHSKTRLTQVDGLYQIDLHGDRSGVWESGRDMLTLHHWKEGYWSENGEGLDSIRHPRWFPMDKMALVQDVCGDTCFLQRFLFGTGKDHDDTILTNGYSIANYPTGALHKLLTSGVHATEEGHLTSFDKMERTWSPARPMEDTSNDGFEHYLCPCRPALELEVEKIHWRLMDATSDGQGGVRQYFRRFGREGRLEEWVELHFTREG